MKKRYINIFNIRSSYIFFFFILFTYVLATTRPFSLFESKTNNKNSVISPTKVEKPQNLYKNDTLQYLKEITLGENNEITLSNTERFNTQYIKKWNKPVINIKTHGDFNNYLSNCLDNIIYDFNNLSETSKLLVKPKNDSDINIYLLPYEQFKTIIGDYSEKEKNYGLFIINNNENYEIYNAQILINSNESDRDKDRCHLIREELTQSMGLINDSNKYSDSIFFEEHNPTLYYNELDKEVIRLFMSENIRAGMTIDDLNSLIEKN